MGGFKNPARSVTALLSIAVHCDQAGCLTEASTGSITDEQGKQKAVAESRSGYAAAGDAKSVPPAVAGGSV